jgi:molybdenum cofactor biosynthesis protein B
VSADNEFIPVNIAVMTVSDTRTPDTDTSGQYLEDALLEEGHVLMDRVLVKNDIYHIRAVLSDWIADPEVEAVLITGGTGFSAHDCTPEAVKPLFDKAIDGYGELFRNISYNDITTSAIQSRAVAGIANNTVVFCMPGSNNACQTAWEGIIRTQLDATHKSCTFVKLITQNRVAAEQCESRE